MELSIIACIISENTDKNYEYHSRVGEPRPTSLCYAPTTAGVLKKKTKQKHYTDIISNMRMALTTHQLYFRANRE